MKRKNIIVNLTPLLFMALLCNSCGYGDCGDNNHYRTDTLSKRYLSSVVFKKTISLFELF